MGAQADRQTLGKAAQCLSLVMFESPFIHLPHFVNVHALASSLKVGGFPAGGPPGPNSACATRPQRISSSPEAGFLHHERAGWEDALMTSQVKREGGTL